MVTLMSRTTLCCLENPSITYSRGGCVNISTEDIGDHFRQMCQGSLEQSWRDRCEVMVSDYFYKNSYF